MNAQQLDQLSIAITCPDCGGEIEKTFEWIKDNKAYWCPMCHVEIHLDSRATHQAVAEIKLRLKEVQRAVLDFQLSIKG